MQTQNITLSLPKELLKKVKILAVRRGTSVSSLLQQYLAQLLNEDVQYHRAYQRQKKLLQTGFDLGTGDQIIIRRDDLHDRR